MTHTTITKTATATGADATVCADCGRTAAGTAPLDWVHDVDMSTAERVVRYHCAECARANLRSIEAGLRPSDW